MTQTTARLTKGKNHFEVLVDLDSALKFKKGESDYLELEIDKVFTNAKKGENVAKDVLEVAFGTSNPLEVGKMIVKQGEVLIDQEHRDEVKENKIKQVIDFLARNAIDPQTGRSHTSERLKNALDQAHVTIKNVPIENQITEILEQLNRIIPIKVETKKIKITIPAIQTGKAYGLVAIYKERETWLNDGSLEVVVKVPAGLVMDFYDKLNSMTHGSAITTEINE
jgi:ribosome maturation protein SDO1